jgi:hypothetical protein
MAQYGEVRVDFITYTTGVAPNEGNVTVPVSGLINTPTFSGDVNINGALNVSGLSTFSGITVTGDATVEGNLNVSGDINASGVTISGITGLFAPGTEAAPSISFVDDTDTGIYNAAANEIRITTSGNDRLTVDSDGKVGVGTSSPSRPLTVNGVIQSESFSAGGLFYGAYTGTTAGSQLGVLDFYSTGTGVTGEATIRGILDTGSTTSAYLSFNTASSGTLAEKVRITSDGNVGIGTTSPEQLLDVRGVVQIKNAGTCTLRFNDSTTNYWDIQNDSNLRFSRGGSEYARIDSSGRLLVGTSSARRVGSTTFPLSLYESTTHTILAVVANNVSGGTLCLGGTGGSSIGSNTLVSDNQTIGGIRFAAADGADLQSDCARIFAQIDGTPDANDVPGRLVFGTTADGASSPIERMRLDSLGQLLIGRTGTDALCRLGMGYGSNTAGTYIEVGRTNRNGNGLNKLFLFRHGYWAGSQEVASIGVLTTSSTAGSGHGYGNLVFHTGEGGNGDSGSTSVERFRIANNGNVQVFTTTTSPTNSQITSANFRVGANGWDTSAGSRPYYLEIAPSANYAATWGYSRATIEFTIQSSRTNERYNFMVADYAGNVNFPQAISKGSGSFKIKHPLPEKKETQYLVHSFIEGPQADLIYRGYVTLKDGKATVNIDNAARMSEGTFVLLCGNVSCFTSNESDWTAVRGSVSENILTIEAQDPTSTAKVSWMVVGERIDDHMLETDWTDENGRVITEPFTEKEEIRIASLKNT